MTYQLIWTGDSAFTLRVSVSDGDDRAYVFELLSDGTEASNSWPRVILRIMSEAPEAARFEIPNERTLHAAKLWTNSANSIQIKLNGLD